ncbi:MAG: hypothetical protein H0X49_16895 [Acidobacteria bacterium]|nr:hypothetical protein [Acidobacteriota bacterium]MBA4185657.1 hypothetical protein [Acidobacteriota bacterium]
MKNELSEKVRNLARFARAMRKIRLRFPEHARELDRALYDVGQKLESCSDPDCDCKQSFEEFHAQTNRLVEEELREKSYEFN